TREDEAPSDDDEQELVSPLPAGARNYMTPGGFARMKDELEHLVQKERPELVATVAWAASNGDRSENADYIYGKKRLREIDRRIRFLIRRLDVAELAALERKQASLIAHTRALRAANEALRRDLAAANARNHALAARVTEARERLDALLSRLPEAAE